MATIEFVKEVRERSGAPLGECASALKEANGDIDQAMVVLQKRGIMRASELTRRATTEGRITQYIHGEGQIAVLVEVSCETDFVARSLEFKSFCDAVAMQIAAMNPKYVSSKDILPEALEQQSGIYQSQLLAEKKPEASWAKIVEGKKAKWYAEVCLLEQNMLDVPDVTGCGHVGLLGGPKKTVDECRASFVALLGENIRIVRFVRWYVGTT